MKKAIILSCLIGTAIEWFDYSMFAVVSPILAAVFLPEQGYNTSLLKIFMMFFSGFLLRPLAGFFWGIIADKLGRKVAVVATINIMALTSALMSILPTYAMVGFLAPCMLFVLRIVQGFSASGEHGSMLTFLYESSNGQRMKTTMSSLSMVGVFLGMAFSTLLGFLLYKYMPTVYLNAWGWRLPFLISAAIGFVGVYLRKNALETTRYQRKSTEKMFHVLFKLKKADLINIIKGIGIFQLAVAVPYIIFVFCPVMQLEVNIASSVLRLVTFTNLLITAISTALFAYLSTVIKVNLRLTSILLIIFFMPLLLGCIHTNEIHLFGLFQLCLGCCTAMLVGPFCGDLARKFAPSVRATSVGLCINISAAIFGGMSPMLMAYFQTLRNPTLISIAFISVLCFIALISELNFSRDVSDGGRLLPARVGKN